MKYNGIIAWHSFFHLNQNDQRAMFPRFAALAAPGAALMFTAGHFDGVAMGEFAGEPLYHASLSAEEYTACSRTTASPSSPMWCRTRNAAAPRSGWPSGSRSGLGRRQFDSTNEKPAVW
jgi:hypothetical protein